MAKEATGPFSGLSKITKSPTTKKEEAVEDRYTQTAQTKQYIAILQYIIQPLDNVNVWRDAWGGATRWRHRYPQVQEEWVFVCVPAYTYNFKAYTCILVVRATFIPMYNKF